ncbi:stage V sporulation protein G [Finegoldia magna SY403409CC001050417]|uniref:Putative septation protein SpoVG n=1 Tax=Finegoldia magna TaxID=1260 RepID=A0A7D4JZ11_FINMA|nr:septation regulator SpoVG [Finegoldia magna]EGS33563.1 stage V sporulation protein G [Finegoldia magna SY403409CC001050417]QKH80096.1 septation regulator SpoVG [Finegoldia magna]
MQITDVRIKLLNIDNRLKAIASVTFDDEIVIHDIKVIEGEEDLFLAMPSRKVGNDRYRDIAHPISSPAREKIETAVINKYNEEFEKQSSVETEPVSGENMETAENENE